MGEARRPSPSAWTPASGCLILVLGGWGDCQGRGGSMQEAKGGALVKRHPTAPFPLFASVMGKGGEGAREKDANDHCLLVGAVAPPPESVVNLARD